MTGKRKGRRQATDPWRSESSRKRPRPVRSARGPHRQSSSLRPETFGQARSAAQALFEPVGHKVIAQARQRIAKVPDRQAKATHRPRREPRQRPVLCAPLEATLEKALVAQPPHYQNVTEIGDLVVFSHAQKEFEVDEIGYRWVVVQPLVAQRPAKRHAAMRIGNA